MPDKKLPPDWGNNGSTPASWTNDGKNKKADKVSKESSNDISSCISENKEVVSDESKHNSKPNKANAEKLETTNTENGDNFIQTKLVSDKIDISDNDIDHSTKTNNEINNKTIRSYADDYELSLDENKKTKSKKSPKTLRVSTVVLIIIMTLSLAFLSVFIVLYFADRNSDNGTDNSVVSKTTESTAVETIATANITESTTELTTTKVTEPPTSEVVEKNTESEFTSYTLAVSAYTCVYDGPGYNYSIVEVIEEEGIYTIVDEAMDIDSGMWGKLKSGSGWINITDATYNSSDSYTSDNSAQNTYNNESQNTSPNAETNTLVVNGITFEHITSYTVKNTTVKINKFEIEKSHLNNYTVKVNGEVTDLLDRDKYLAYFEYDDDGYLLGKYYLSTSCIDGEFKNSYTLTVWNDETVRVFIDVAA